MPTSPACALGPPQVAQAVGSSAEQANQPQEATAAPAGAPHEGARADQPAGARPGAEDPTLLPPHGCEVFIGGLARTATEDHLRRFAQQTGKVTCRPVPVARPARQPGSAGLASPAAALTTLALPCPSPPCRSSRCA